MREKKCMIFLSNMCALQKLLTVLVCCQEWTNATKLWVCWQGQKH